MISWFSANITQLIDNRARDSSVSNVSWEEPIAADNSGVQTLNSSHDPGSSFPVGVTEVTYTSTDPSGNKETQTFFITVKSKYVCLFVCLFVLLFG